MFEAVNLEPKDSTGGSHALAMFTNTPPGFYRLCYQVARGNFALVNRIPVTFGRGAMSPTLRMEPAIGPNAGTYAVRAIFMNITGFVGSLKEHFSVSILGPEGYSEQVTTFEMVTGGGAITFQKPAMTFTGPATVKVVVKALGNIPAFGNITLEDPSIPRLNSDQPIRAMPSRGGPLSVMLRYWRSLRFCRPVAWASYQGIVYPARHNADRSPIPI